MQADVAVRSHATEETVFTFPSGLFGFPEAKRYTVHALEGVGEQFRQMVSLDLPDILFTLVNPVALLPGYVPEIPDQDLQALEASSLEELVVMTVISFSPDPRQPTVNLRAPLLFNPFKRLGRQIILPTDTYAVKHPLFPAAR